MGGDNAKENSTVSVTFSADQRAMLTRRAHDAGQSIDEYIRERVLEETTSGEQALRFLVEELTKVADENRQALPETKPLADTGTKDHRETDEARRARIAREVRDSFTQHELAERRKLWRAGEKGQP